MNEQRSETGLNWCSADCVQSYKRDRDCGYDSAYSSAAVISGSGAQHRLRRLHHRGCIRSEDRQSSFCQRTGGKSGAGPLVTRSASPCPSCAGRGRRPDEAAGMAGGRLSAGTTAPNWREARRIRPRSMIHLELGALVCLQRCFTVAVAWMSSRLFSGGWIVYLFCYLILLHSGCSLSHAWENPRQSHHRTDGTKGDVKTVEQYLQENFPERFNETQDILPGIANDSPINNRVRLGRAGKSRVANTNYNMRLIDKESARASCQPRDTVLDSYKELDIAKGFETRVFPECIVVQRCKNGGCCRDDQECQPLRNGTRNVLKLFLIDAVIQRRYIKEDFACECVEKPDFCSPPETECPHGKTWSHGQCGCSCRKRCPKPFLQDESTCACDCLTNNRVCKNIQRGRKDQKLAVEECECVKQGTCATPNCANGRFSLNKCKCVQEERRWS